jgi:23S rRNA pseudouridine1911/1915/1917 synthase
LILKYIVRPNQEGRELKSILKYELRLSTSLLRKLKAASAITVNGRPEFISYRVCAADEIVLVITEPPADYPPEEEGVESLDILYEDTYLLGLNKPQGMLIHPSHSRLTGTLSNTALAYILRNGGDGCHAVNRLDRDTGGVVLYAKNGYIKSLMSDKISAKEYLAVVCGVPSPQSGTIELPIKRAHEGDMLRITAPDGSYCRTDYTVIGSFNGLSLLRLRLFTGRTHQIRVHCHAIGCPVLGDRLYCNEESMRQAERYGTDIQHLHAIRLAFTHPITSEIIKLKSLPGWEILRLPGSNWTEIIKGI